MDNSNRKRTWTVLENIVPLHRAIAMWFSYHTVKWNMSDEFAMVQRIMASSLQSLLSDNGMQALLRIAYHATGQLCCLNTATLAATLGADTANASGRAAVKGENGGEHQEKYRRQGEKSAE